MHEYAAVEDVVSHLQARLTDENVKSVTSVRFKRSSAFSEEALRQAFTALTAGTVLEGAPVEVEVDNVDFRCSCGYAQTVQSSDLIGHMFVCPNCGAIREIEQCHDLSLVDITVED